MIFPVILEPHERAQLTLDYLTLNPIEKEIDFIEPTTGYLNLSHAWDQFDLKLEVVEGVDRRQINVPDRKLASWLVD